ETAIPMPGLPESRSQLAVPILAGEDLYGVLYVESPEDMRFSYDDEDMLQVLAQQFGWIARNLALTEVGTEVGGETAGDAASDSVPDAASEAAPGAAVPVSATTKPVLVRYF